MKKKDPKTSRSYPAKSYPARYTGVLLEEIRDKVKLVAESVDMTRVELSDKIAGVDQRLSQEISDAKAGLTMRIDRVEKELTGVKAELSGVKAELSGVKAELSGVKSELSGVKIEFSGVKTKIDEVGARLDRHDHEIQELKQAQA